MTNKIIVKNSFEMPAVDETVELIVSESCNLVPECWIWNESVGYLKVNKFNLYDDKIIVENLGRRENAKKGTVFPSCMEFLITAPSALDPYNPLSTCLAADFNSPTVGNTALMSVGSTYVIKADDQIIVDGDYRYSVVQVINSTTLKVLNEGLGKDGIIEVGCDSCVPVQVVSKLNCCPIPSGDLTSNTSVLTVIDGADVLLDSASLTLDTDLSQYDNSVAQFIDVTGVPRGTLSSNSILITVTDGINNVLDNISLDLDTDLSKYNNTTSGYITLGDVPRGTLSSDSNLITVLGGVNNVLDNISLDLDTDLSKYDNSTSEFLATSDKKNLTSNTTVLTVTNGTGTTLENTSLTLDTDLSQYDNTTSSFLANSDKKDLSSTTPILTITNGTGATLENTMVSLNTDLSQYDNSVSQFVSAGGLASGTLSSNSSLLTVNNGTDSILTNVSLDLDTDLSQYDNTTSAFITLGDIPALPADTDLANYDNTNSGFITSASLPTVNDATLTIYNSDGVTPFVTFTANAASNVTATLPASGGSYTATAPISIDANNDISISQATTSTDGYLSSTDWNTFNNKASALVYFEETYSIGRATWAKTNAASIADLGTYNNYFNTVYALILQGGSGYNSYIKFNSNGSDTEYHNGTSTSYNAHAFYSGGKKLVAFAYTQAEYSTDIIPTTTSTYNIGGASNTWNNAYIDNLYATTTYTTNLHINNITHSEVANIIVQNATFDFSNVIGVSNLYGSSHTISSDTISISNSYSHTIKCLIDVDMLASRLRVAQDTGAAQIDIFLKGYIEIINMTASTTNTISVSEWYAGRILNAGVSGNGWYETCPTFTYTNSINLNANSSYKIRAYAVFSFAGGNTDTTIRLPGGVNQNGFVRTTLIVQ